MTTRTRQSSINGRSSRFIERLDVLIASIQDLRDPARVGEKCFYSLESPVIRVGAPHTPYPPSRVEEEFLPDLDRVLDAVDRAFAY